MIDICLAKPPQIDDPDELRRLIAYADEQIRYWTDRDAQEAAGGRFSSLDAQNARHRRGRYDDHRQSYLAQLRALGLTYDGPPKVTYEMDITREERYGQVQYHTTQVTQKRCTHSVEATSLDEARQLAISDHLANCDGGI